MLGRLTRNVLVRSSQQAHVVRMAYFSTFEPLSPPMSTTPSSLGDEDRKFTYDEKIKHAKTMRAYDLEQEAYRHLSHGEIKEAMEIFATALEHNAEAIRDVRLHNELLHRLVERGDGAAALAVAAHMKEHATYSGAAAMHLMKLVTHPSDRQLDTFKPTFSFLLELLEDFCIFDVRPTKEEATLFTKAIVKDTTAQGQLMGPKRLEKLATLMDSRWDHFDADSVQMLLSANCAFPQPSAQVALTALARIESNHPLLLKDSKIVQSLITTTQLNAREQDGERLWNSYFDALCAHYPQTAKKLMHVKKKMLQIIVSEQAKAVAALKPSDKAEPQKIESSESSSV